MFLIKSLITLQLINVIICYPSSNWEHHAKKISSIGQNFPYVPRHDWNALPTKDILVSSHQSIPTILVKHTNTPYCYRKRACARSVRKLQHQFMVGGFNDIQYNFIIDPHGNVYEGLGWFNLQTQHFDQAYRIIGFIGMDNTEITSKQSEALTKLFAEALDLNILNNNYHLCSTPNMIEPLKNIKMDLEMEMDYVKNNDITKMELRKLKNDLSMENIDCVRKL